MSPMTGGECFWMATVPATDYATLAEDISADACVVGAGITGLLTAWELLDAGLDVVVLDSRRIVSAVTGYTTAKLTSQHGLKYHALEQRLGAEAARWYGAANERGLARVIALAAELGIDADLEHRDAYVYASRPESTVAVRAEAEAAARAGLPASFTTDVPLPFATHGAVVFTGQAQLHPRKFLVALAEQFVARGGRIFEQTRVTEVAPGGAGTRSIVTTEGTQRVSADHVVLATLLPSPLGGNLTNHLYCHQGYAVALPVTSDPLPTGMFINSDRPMRSLRTINSPAGTLLQVGGSAYVDDPNTSAGPWADLDGWGCEQFAAAGASAATFRWTTQDYSSADGLPLIGRLEPGSEVYVATGFGGWGLTTAGFAAALIREQVLGNTADWHTMFDPARELPVTSTKIISSHRHGLGIAPGQALAELAPDSALVLEIDGEEVAAYRDPAGELHRVSAACTHLGCIVLWAKGDRQWECPCHGSRFAPDGTVIKGPAKEPLPAR